MIKFRRGKNIVLGLTERDIRALKAGVTIKLNLKEMGIDANVVIIKPTA